jgi:DNA-binding PadR family transcriptional regulator
VESNQLPILPIDRRSQGRSRRDDLTITPSMLVTLLAIATRPRHGLGIVDEIEQRSKGEMTLSIATLYRSIARLYDIRLITDVRNRPPRTRTRDGSKTGSQRTDARSLRARRRDSRFSRDGHGPSRYRASHEPFMRGFVRATDLSG